MVNTGVVSTSNNCYYNFQKTKNKSRENFRAKITEKDLRESTNIIVYIFDSRIFPMFKFLHFIFGSLTNKDKTAFRMKSLLKLNAPCRFIEIRKSSEGF